MSSPTLGRPLRRAAIGLRTRSWPGTRSSSSPTTSRGGCSSTRRASSSGLHVRSAWRSGRRGWVKGVDRQSIFHLSQFTLLLHDFERRENRLGFAYFHGRPGTPGMPEFDACFETLRRRHAEIDRVQVTSSAMQELILETGIAAEKLHRIPIGIDTEVFPSAHTAESLRGPPRARAPRVRVRRRLVPEGRRRLGRRAGAEADQGPGRAARGRRASARASARAGGPPHRPVAWIRASRAGAARGSASPRASALRRRRLAGVRGHRRLPRHLARRGRAARGSRVHGDRGAARDDARRTGARPRAAWGERLDRGRRGRRRARRVDGARGGSARRRARRPSRSRADHGRRERLRGAPSALARALRRVRRDARAGG